MNTMKTVKELNYGETFSLEQGGTLYTVTDKPVVEKGLTLITYRLTDDFSRGEFSFYRAGLTTVYMG